MNRQELTDEVIKRKAVAVLRIKDESKLKNVIQAIYDGGITCIEITMTVPNAISLIEKMSEEFKEKVIIGVGTILDATTAESAIKAGAKYVVSPIYKKEIIDIAHKFDVPAMTGCFSPTEIQTAYEAGADIIKVFPADVLGMNFFKGILAPMPYLKLMPTGGVTLTNAGEWIEAGAVAVGVGSALTDKKSIESNDYKKITENAISIMDSIKNSF